MGNTCIIQILVLITKIFFKNEKFRCTFQLPRCMFGPTVFLWVACMWSVYSLLLLLILNTLLVLLDLEVLVGHTHPQCNVYAVKHCKCNMYKVYDTKKISGWNYFYFLILHF